MGHGDRNERAFSLLELIIVVSVLTVLAAVITPQVNRMVIKSKISRIETEMKTIKTAVNTLFADMKVFPADAGANVDPGLQSARAVPADLEANWLGPYLDHWPTAHPWGGSYDYDHGSNANFNKDGILGNEVFLTVRDNLTADILGRIDSDLDDGSPLTGNIRHDASSTLRYFIGEGPAW
jgi:general secretion pathway protein G